MNSMHVMTLRILMVVPESHTFTPCLGPFTSGSEVAHDLPTAFNKIAFIDTSNMRTSCSVWLGNVDSNNGFPVQSRTSHH